MTPRSHNDAIPSAHKAAGVKVLYDVGVPMSDGVRLSADVYLPTDTKGPFPTILYRTPYSNQMEYLIERANFFAQHGYAVVCQDVRGRYDSQGEFTRWTSEFEDGHETVEWVGAQPWCDGNVGMDGPSYLGYVQWQAAIGGSRFLMCIVPQLRGGDRHESPHYQGGAFQLALNATWAFRTDARTMQEIDGYDWERLLYTLPVRDIPAAAGRDVPDFVNWVDNPDFGPHWTERNVLHRLDVVKVPALHIGGWYDLYPAATLNLFNGMRERGGSAEARANQRVIIGPWIHAASTLTHAGDVDFGKDSVLDLPEIELAWFDHWLKGMDNGADREAPLKLFLTGSGEWRDERKWPLARTQFTPFYLRSDGNANSAAGDGALSITKPSGANTSGEPSDAYTYDPQFPVPTRGGGNCCDPQLVPWGAFDQREVEARSDVLVYSTEILESDVEVTGPVVLKLFASTDGRDTDFTAKLVDVFPDGRAINLTDGILRGRYRKGTDEQVLLTPGTAYEFEIDMWVTANVFKAGHRIRLEVSSSNFPRFDRNPNTGNPFGQDTELRTAHQTVFHDADRPSHLLMPVIPVS
jgi:putative CocE/NonD family hydrolase